MKMGSQFGALKFNMNACFVFNKIFQNSALVEAFYHFLQANESPGEREREQ